MKNEIPKHVGIIMDGNGRWATRRGLPRSMGHKAGYETFKKTALYILKKGVKYLSVFAFSTENFKRSKEEVGFLMDLFIDGFSNNTKDFIDNDVRVVFSGREENVPTKLYKVMKKLEKDTEKCKGGILNICLNYGGQAEIVDTTKKIVSLVQEGKLDINDLNEETYYHYLYNDLPGIDLLIRTSGEERISNFMLYSLSYSEIVFTKTCFPDFTPEEFDKCLEEYQNRNITKGGVK